MDLLLRFINVEGFLSDSGASYSSFVILNAPIKLLENRYIASEVTFISFIYF